MEQSEKLQTINTILKKLHRMNLNPEYRFYFDSHRCSGCYRIMFIDMTPHEFIGTGMKLQVTKDDKVIEVTVIVLGDINGNGEVGGDTLTALRGILYEDIEVSEIYLKALDINANQTIEGDDLTLIRGVLYEDAII